MILSQEKNNLGRLDLPSLTYVVRDTEIETEDGQVSVGRVEFTGETAQSVGDVLADSGTAPEERSERAEAAAWLRDFLTRNGGEASAEDVFKAGAQAGFEKHTLRRCKPKAQVKSEKAGFDGGRPVDALPTRARHCAHWWASLLWPPPGPHAIVAR